MDTAILKDVKVPMTFFLCKTEALKYYYAFVYIPTRGINGLIRMENTPGLLSPDERIQLEKDGEVEILIKDEWVDVILSWLIEKWFV